MTPQEREHLDTIAAAHAEVERQLAVARANAAALRLLRDDPPRLDGDIEITDLTPTGYRASWQRATDDDQVASVFISLDGGMSEQRLDPDDTELTVNGRAPESTDTVLVWAVDNGGRASNVLRRQVVLPAAPPAPDPKPPAPPAPSPTGKYRDGQPLLLQSSAVKELAPTLPGPVMRIDKGGPSREAVSERAQWLWQRVGGDWIDADDVPQGTRPWVTIPTSRLGAGVAHTYESDATALVQRCHADQRWLAILLRAVGRPIAGRHSDTPPVIEGEYEDGTPMLLACTCTAGASTVSPNTADALIQLPALVEFERPARAVQSARLQLTVLSHQTNVAQQTIEGYLLDPPRNTSPVQHGLAAQAGALDEGLAERPELIGVHRYVDGASLSDFVAGEGIATGAEYNYSPHLWDETVTPDTSLLPYKHVNRWVNAGANWSLVDSAYRAEGFEPLAPGMGAARIAMPARPGLKPGDVVGFGGTLGTSAYLFMPEPLFGRLQRIYVRHYFRLGTPDGGPYKRELADYFEILHQVGKGGRIDHGGKFGLMPEHASSYGGNSGSGGGGRGWTIRSAWTDCKAGDPGPDQGGIGFSPHMWDFQQNNPPGHNYANQQFGFGQLGGLGAVLYAHQWYCLESEVTLNSVDKPAVLPDGTPHMINGVQQYWTADGALRQWVDGRLVFERQGLVMRSLPLFDPGAGHRRSMHIRPCRELGVRGVWFNWFHGGVTPNSVDRVIFVTGVAWGHQYIGPMRIN